MSSSSPSPLGIGNAATGALDSQGIMTSSRIAAVAPREWICAQNRVGLNRFHTATSAPCQSARPKFASAPPTWYIGRSW